MDYEKEYKKMVEYLTYSKNMKYLIWILKTIILCMVVGIGNALIYGIIVMLLIDIPAWWHFDNKIKRDEDKELMNSIFTPRN